MARIISELIYKLIADDKELVKSLKKAESDLDSLSKKFTDTGKKLTLGLTAPILAAFGAMTKLASDTGEALNAANVVFEESSGIITEWGKTAAEQAGLTSAEFYQMSAVLGAQLKNAGLSTDEAATKTIELTKRAADMASIFNTDVNDALGAMQALLRGESEPIRRYAVSIDQAAVSAEALAQGLIKTGEEMTPLAKSQATYSLLMKQTDQFAGDFVNTSDQLANGMRVTTAQLKEQAAKFGELLLPLLLKGVTAARDFLEGFTELDDVQRKNILTIAAIAAAIGPLLIVIGKSITAFGTMKTAVTGIKTVLGAAAGPVGWIALAATAVAGLTIAVINSKKQHDAELESIIAKRDALETTKTQLQDVTTLTASYISKKKQELQIEQSLLLGQMQAADLRLKRAQEFEKTYKDQIELLDNTIDIWERADIAERLVNEAKLNGITITKQQILEGKGFGLIIETGIDLIKQEVEVTKENIAARQIAVKNAIDAKAKEEEVNVVLSDQTGIINDLNTATEKRSALTEYEQKALQVKHNQRMAEIEAEKEAEKIALDEANAAAEKRLELDEKYSSALQGLQDDIDNLSMSEEELAKKERDAFITNLDALELSEEQKIAAINLYDEKQNLIKTIDDEKAAEEELLKTQGEAEELERVRLENQSAYNNLLNNLNDSIDNLTLSEYELSQKERDLFIAKLDTLGLTQEETQAAIDLYDQNEKAISQSNKREDIEAKLEAARRSRVQKQKDDEAELLKQQEENAQSAEKIETNLLNFSMQQVEKYNEQRKAAADEAYKQQEELRTKQAEADNKYIEDQAAAWDNLYSELINKAIDFVNLLFDIKTDESSRELDLLSEQQKQEIDKLKSDYDNKLFTEEEYKKQQEEIEKKYNSQMAQLEYEKNLNSWRQQTLNILASAAMAAVKLAESTAILGPVGMYIALGALGVFTAGQIAQQKKAKPKPPQFQSGVNRFMVPDGFNNDNYPVMVQSGERVTVETPSQQAINGDKILIHNTLKVREYVFADMISELIADNQIKGIKK